MTTTSWGQRTGQRPAVGEFDRTVVAIEPRWSMAPSGEVFTRGDDYWRRLHLAPEIRRVESPTKHGFMHMAQLGEGEGLTEEGMSDAALLHLGAQSPEGVFDDGVVVENEELLKIGGTERRRVEEVSPGSMLEALGRIDRPTRQRPTPSERLADAADKRQPDRCRLALLLP